MKYVLIFSFLFFASSVFAVSIEHHGYCPNSHIEICNQMKAASPHSSGSSCSNVFSQVYAYSDTYTNSEGVLVSDTHRFFPSSAADCFHQNPACNIDSVDFNISLCSELLFCPEGKTVAGTNLENLTCVSDQDPPPPPNPDNTFGGCPEGVQLLGTFNNIPVCGYDITADGTQTTTDTTTETNTDTTTDSSSETTTDATGTTNNTTNNSTTNTTHNTTTNNTTNISNITNNDIDNSGVEQRLDNINDTLTDDSYTYTGQASFDDSASNTLAQMQSEFESRFDEIKLEIQEKLAIDFGNSGGQLYSDIKDIKGVQVDFGLQKFEQSGLNLIGNLILFLASLVALRIILD